MMSIQESSEFDLVALGASALIELALGAPLEIAEDKPDPKAFVVVEEIKPVGPASILPTPRPDRTTSQGLLCPHRKIPPTASPAAGKMAAAPLCSRSFVPCAASPLPMRGSPATCPMACLSRIATC